jgi:stage V sporulation protein G
MSQRQNKKRKDENLKISDIRIRLVKKEDSKLKAVASMTIEDCFVIHDIKIIQGTESVFISMPSRKTPDGEYKDIVHPINTPTREMIREAILAEYEKALTEEKE